MRNMQNIPNTVVYDEIMISYTDSDYVPFNDFSNVHYEDLPLALTDWAESSAASGVTGINLKTTVFQSDIPKPSANSDIPIGLTVNGLFLIPYNSAYLGTEGLSVSTDGTVMLYIEGCSSKAEYIAWLTAHPVTLNYSGASSTIEPFNAKERKYTTGEIITFAESTSVDYYYSDSVSESYKMVCFGDSITGMYGFDTDYPSMITNGSKIEAINCGFSGSCWTDYGVGINMPFSINRLIDAVVSEDYTLQDDAIGSHTTAFYAEYYANLKSVDWSKITYVTFFA